MITRGRGVSSDDNVIKAVSFKIHITCFKIFPSKLRGLKENPPCKVIVTSQVSLGQL